jgi:hypothetical protein
MLSDSTGKALTQQLKLHFYLNKLKHLLGRTLIVLQDSKFEL